jgi:transposase
MNDLKQKIRYLKDVLGLSFRQIQNQLAVSRKKASRLYSNASKDKTMKKKTLLDSYRSLIGEWFAECPSLKASQVYQRLQARGVKVSYPTVTLETIPFRKRRQTIYHPLEFLPGEEGQVDWFFLNLPPLGKICGFALIVSYSRYLFAHLFPRSSFEFFIEGHLKAFESFGGLPQTLVYDNLSSVVLKRQPLQYNPRFLEFAHHYRFQIRLCNPASGNEKGRVERVIRTLKETFFNAVSVTSLEGLNQSLHQWVKGKNEGIHRATGKKPIDLFGEEKLKPLPGIRFNNVTVHPPKITTKTGLMIFDTNLYSVPDYLNQKSLSIHSSCDKIEIFDGDKRVASHPRCFEFNQKKINPLHRSFAKISSEAKRERIFCVIKNMDQILQEFLERNQGAGEDPYSSAYQIFKILPRVSRGILISAVRECLQRKTPRIKTLLSLLELQPTGTPEVVFPQRQDLLEISYLPRPLKEYDHES